jgi:hypothetical protein
MRNHLFGDGVRRQLELSRERLLTRLNGMGTYEFATQFTETEYELVDALYESVLAQLALERLDEESAVTLLARVALELSQLDRAVALRSRHRLPETANGQTRIVLGWRFPFVQHRL